MTYDFIVIGGGLPGLIAASALTSSPPTHGQSPRVLVLEPEDNLLGHLKNVVTPDGVLAHGVPLLPDGENAGSALESLAALLPQGLHREKVELQVSRAESNRLSPFVGFGDHPPAFVDQLSPFLSQSQWLTDPAPGDWAGLLSQNPNFEVQLRSTVTRFEIADQKIKSILVNGQKKYSAHHFIYASSLDPLKKLIAADHWPAKALSRFSKLKSWTLLGWDTIVPILDPEYRSQYPGSRIYLLDDDGTYWGQMTAFDSKLMSQWWTLIEDEEAEDSEGLAQTLRKMKRQIRKAFPLLAAKEDQEESQIVFERVCVLPSYSVPSLQKGILPSLDNLSFINSQQLNPLAVIQAAFDASNNNRQAPSIHATALT